MAKFFSCLFLILYLPVFADSCDDDDPPCPGSYETEFEKLKTNEKEMCQPVVKMTLKSCDLEDQDNIKKLQSDTKRSFYKVLDSKNDSINETCQVFSGESARLQNELAGFRTSCGNARDQCFATCDPIIMELEELQKKASKRECCEDLSEDIADFVKDDVKKRRRSCYDQKKELEDAEYEQNKWAQAKHTATQCWTSTSEHHGNMGYYSGPHSHNKPATDPLPTANTKEPEPPELFFGDTPKKTASFKEAAVSRRELRQPSYTMQ